MSEAGTGGSFSPVVTLNSESLPRRIFGIVAVHVQCSKLFKGEEFTALFMLLCTMKTVEVTR